LAPKRSSTTSNFRSAPPPLYLTDKGGAGATYRTHVQRVSRKSGADLRRFVTDRALAFAHLWYAKKVAEYEGKSAIARGLSS
jgi:hypothetical protein